MGTEKIITYEKENDGFLVKYEMCLPQIATPEGVSTLEKNQCR